MSRPGSRSAFSRCPRSGLLRRPGIGVPCPPWSLVQRLLKAPLKMSATLSSSPHSTMTRLQARTWGVLVLATNLQTLLDLKLAYAHNLDDVYPKQVTSFVPTTTTTTTRCPTVTYDCWCGTGQSTVWATNSVGCPTSCRCSTVTTPTSTSTRPTTTVCPTVTYDCWCGTGQSTVWATNSVGCPTACRCSSLSTPTSTPTLPTTTTCPTITYDCWCSRGSSTVWATNSVGCPTSCRCSGTSTPTTNPGGQILWGQCGGNGWTGPNQCREGRCHQYNEWYSK